MARSCRPDAVRYQVGIESFRLRPDGGEVAYVRRHVSGSSYHSHLWSVSIDGGSARQLTRGAVRDSSPAYSPDGTQLAFVRTPDGADHGQPWILPHGGGEPWPLATMAHGVSSVSWSPDGQWLALLAPSADDRPFIVGPEEAGKSPRARRITSLDWRDDEQGHRDRRVHLYLIRPRADARPQRLTGGDWDVLHPAWAPDSRSIAFTTDQHAERDLDPRSSVWVVDVAGGQPREQVALQGDADFPAYSPDGTRLACLGRDAADAPEYAPLDPWLVPADGGQAAQIALETDGLVGTWAWSELDLIEGAPGPLWLDAASLVCLIAGLRPRRCFDALSGRRLDN